MNLRKALDRARKEREQQICLDDVSPGTISRPEVSAPGWQPPVYSESKKVTINIKTAIQNHCIALAESFEENNYYKVLRTQLRQLSKRKKWNTIMVTSTSANEGKTVTSINLAATFAREHNQTVLLVDADLRMQMIHRYLGYHRRLGLLDYLERNADMRDIISWPGIEKLTIISGERVIDDSSELISSPRMQSLMKDLKNRYDDRFVIFDAPPILGVADTLAFAPLVDCIVIVVGAGITSRNDLKEAIGLLPQDKIAGFILNRHKNPNKLYGRYGYRYGRKVA
ncbi:CpsD/CapB family tyrosine-protein kinase [Desulfosarcina variabilis]|uniref:CpsD/CapB family tyrosine-protein kinase n=1 Tax=Desulfosarcina variabilis TaxID=2300 RepID=UPI003AFA9C83